MDALGLLEGLGKVLLFLSSWLAADEILPADMLRYIKTSIKSISIAIAVPLFSVVAWAVWIGSKPDDQAATFPAPEWPPPAPNWLGAVISYITGHIYHQFAAWGPWAAHFIAPLFVATVAAMFAVIFIQLGLSRIFLKGENSPKWKERRWRLTIYSFAIGSGLDFAVWAVKWVEEARRVK